MKDFCPRFSNIRGIHFVSCLSGKGIQAFLSEMQTIIATQACPFHAFFNVLLLGLKGFQEHMGQSIPSNYLELERMLHERTRKELPILSWSEFKSLAKSCLIEHEQDLISVSSLLNSLGSLIHFPKDEKVSCAAVCFPRSQEHLLFNYLSAERYHHLGSTMADERPFHCYLNQT